MIDLSYSACISCSYFNKTPQTVIPESGTRRKNGPIIAHLRKNGQIIDPNDEWRICTACPSRFSRNVWTVRAATPQTKKDFEVRRIARSRSQTKMTVARKSDKNLLSQLTLAAESLEVETPSKLTKPKTNYSQLKDKARELRNVKVQLRKVCDGFLAKLENTLAEDLKVNCLAGLYDNKEDGDTAEMDQLVKLQKSVANLYQSIPCNSPIRTSIMKTLFSKNDAGFIAKTLDIDGRNVSRALSEEKQDLAKPLSYYLTNIGFKRDRVKAKGPPLLKFLKECGVPSGRNKRYFVRGTPESMYAEYKLKCIEKGDKFVGPEKFHKVRKHERVGILQGDIFSNPKRIQLKSYKLKLAKLEEQKEKAATLKALKTKIQKIENELEFVDQRKLMYKLDHKELEEDEDTAVLTLDFFATSTTTDFKFQDCICVFASKDKLNIPDSIVEDKSLQ